MPTDPVMCPKCAGAPSEVQAMCPTCKGYGRVAPGHEGEEQCSSCGRQLGPDSFEDGLRCKFCQDAAASSVHSEDMYGGRPLDEIREHGVARLTDKELKRLCERIDYLESLERCNETAPSEPPTFCDRWPGHEGPHRNAVTSGEWGEDAGRLDAR